MSSHYRSIIGSDHLRPLLCPRLCLPLSRLCLCPILPPARRPWGPRRNRRLRWGERRQASPLWRQAPSDATALPNAWCHVPAISMSGFPHIRHPLPLLIFSSLPPHDCTIYYVYSSILSYKKSSFFLQNPKIFRIFAQNLVRDKSVVSARLVCA